MSAGLLDEKDAYAFIRIVNHPSGWLTYKLSSVSLELDLFGLFRNFFYDTRLKIFDFNQQRRKQTYPLFGNFGPEYHAPFGLRLALIENEIPQTVGDYSIFIFFNLLKHMRMMS